jgi:hypothetical protein
MFSLEDSARSASFSNTGVVAEGVVDINLVACLNRENDMPHGPGDHFAKEQARFLAPVAV